MLDTERVPAKDVEGDRDGNVADGDCDKGDADPVNVDPAGAQKGPILNVARCVPTIELRADAVTNDGETVADDSAEGIVRVTDTVKVTESVGDTLEHTD